MINEHNIMNIMFVYFKSLYLSRSKNPKKELLTSWKQLKHTLKGMFWTS